MPIITAFVTCQFIKVQNTFKALGSAQDKKKDISSLLYTWHFFKASDRSLFLNLNEILNEEKQWKSLNTEYGASTYTTILLILCVSKNVTHSLLLGSSSLR